MTRDEILAMAHSVGVRIFDPECCDVITYEELMQFFRLAYTAGAKDMQEGAAKCVGELVSMRVPASEYAAAIRNLEMK